MKIKRGSEMALFWYCAQSFMGIWQNIIKMLSLNQPSVFFSLARASMPAGRTSTRSCAKCSKSGLTRWARLSFRAIIIFSRKSTGRVRDLFVGAIFVGKIAEFLRPHTDKWCLSGNWQFVVLLTNVSSEQIQNTNSYFVQYLFKLCSYYSNAYLRSS